MPTATVISMATTEMDASNARAGRRWLENLVLMTAIAPLGFSLVPALPIARSRGDRWSLTKVRYWSHPAERIARISGPRYLGKGSKSVPGWVNAAAVEKETEDSVDDVHRGVPLPPRQTEYLGHGGSTPSH